MISANKKYPLKEIAKEIQLPFTIRKPNFSSDFYCRVDRIENNIAICTGFKNGKEYTARKYSYSLAEEVVFLNGIRKAEQFQARIAENSEEIRKQIEFSKTIDELLASASSPSGQKQKKENNPPANTEKTQSAIKSAAEAKPVAPEAKNPEPPILYAFFSNPAVMNKAYCDAISGAEFNPKWVQTLAINYLALIKRKIRVIFDNDDFDIDDVEKFNEYFPAYNGYGFDEDDLSSVSLFLADLFDFSLTVYPNTRLSVRKEILSIISIHKCEIRLSSLAFIPSVEKNGEITVFGVFAFINTFLNVDERNSFSFDLLNESSSKSHYYCENLLMKSLPAKSFAKNKAQEVEEKEKTILSLYIHRTSYIHILTHQQIRG